MKLIKTLAAAAVLSGSLNVAAAPMLRIFELGVQRDQVAYFNQAAKANLIPSVQNEAGTLAMHAIRLQDNPNLAYLFEIYADEAANQAHIAGEFYKDYLKVAPSLLTEHKKFTATEVQCLAEKPQPIELKNDEPFPRLNFVEVQVKPEQNATFRQIVLAEMAEAIKVEEGVRAMYAATAKDDPNKWFFIEIYADDEAYQAHRNTPHFQHYLTETANMVTDKTAHNIGWKLLMSKGGLAFTSNQTEISTF